jgi:hypothetical protein
VKRQDIGMGKWRHDTEAALALISMMLVVQG